MTTPPADDDERDFRCRTWPRKFADALRGIKIAMRGEASYFVHILATAIVIIAGVISRLSPTRWALLALCIATVLAAESLNTAIERLARAVTRKQDPQVRDALDIASGAVLLAAIGAAVAGAIILLPPLVAMLERR
ncbi:MAG: diacylglycerol kinase family protein [Planctomycetales bacterium]|nr:diacylglycerol kinase family protein [Planctomycetales bacterium]